MNLKNLQLKGPSKLHRFAIAAEHHRQIEKSKKASKPFGKCKNRPGDRARAEKNLKYQRLRQAAARDRTRKIANYWPEPPKKEEEKFYQKFIGLFSNPFTRRK